MARWSDDLSGVLLGVLLGAAAGYAISVVLRKASSSQAPPSLPPKEPVISLPKPVPEEPEESMISEQPVSEEPVTGPSEEPRYTEEPVWSPPSEPASSLPPRPGAIAYYAELFKDYPPPEVIPPTPGQLAAMMGSPTAEGRPPDETITVPSEVYTLEPKSMRTIFERSGLKYARACAVPRDSHRFVDVRVDYSTFASQQSVYDTWCDSPVRTDFVRVSIINYSDETVTIASPEIILQLWK